MEKSGSIEVKPGEYANYTFSNISNDSNIYLENFKWIDYIPTEYTRLAKMTTGIWNQDLCYSVYYKTNKSNGYILFKENLETDTNHELDFTQIRFEEGEYIEEVYYDFGKVDVGFRESLSPTMKCKTLNTLQDGETFTNRTKTIGSYYELISEAEDEWTTIVHKPKEEHPPVLPRTGE